MLPGYEPGQNYRDLENQIFFIDPKIGGRKNTDQIEGKRHIFRAQVAHDVRFKFIKCIKTSTHAKCSAKRSDTRQKIIHRFPALSVTKIVADDREE